jgi:hypothetical protein
MSSRKHVFGAVCWQASAAVWRGGPGGSPAAQLREYNPFHLYVSSGRSSGGGSSTAVKGIELPELSCRSCSSAGPQNHSCALIWRVMGSARGKLLCPILRSEGAPKLTRSLGSVGGVLSEMHISLKKSCTHFFQSLYACDPKQHPKSQEKCCFHNMSPNSTIVINDLQLSKDGKWHVSLAIKYSYIILFVYPVN